MKCITTDANDCTPHYHISYSLFESYSTDIEKYGCPRSIQDDSGTNVTDTRLSFRELTTRANRFRTQYGKTGVNYVMIKKKRLLQLNRNQLA